MVLTVLSHVLVFFAGMLSGIFVLALCHAAGDDTSGDNSGDHSGKEE